MTDGLEIIPGNVIELKSFLCKGDRWKHGPYLVDRRMSEVTCKTCGAKLNPMDVLHDLAGDESRLRYTYELILKASEAAEKRLRYRCGWCGHFNRLGKNVTKLQEETKPNGA